MAFWNKKKPIDYDPKTFDLENVSLLQKALMAKLLIVNRKLIERFSKLTETSTGLAKWTTFVRYLQNR
jgi:hypothetical protein